MTLTRDTAVRLARLTLGHVGREYPNKLDHVMDGPDDVRGPRALHPIFHGSYDWHSCVHGWWQLLTLARRYPDLAEAEEIVARADALMTPGNVGGELAYLDRPAAIGFERPYGWAWLLMLHAEAARRPERAWGRALAPLAHAIAGRLAGYLPRLTYAIRSGAHYNSAFALVLALEWADGRDAALAALIRAHAERWYGGDRDCPAWEPGGDEFLSPALCEALLMARLHGDGFAAWFDAFLPRAGDGLPATLFTPALVSDRTDPKIAHLDGLNLSRAWCWRGIAAALPAAHPAHGLVAAAIGRHVDAAAAHLADDYAGEHWLASFALLAIDAARL